MVKNEYKLISELLKLSYSHSWSEAKKEWGIHYIYYLDDEPQACLCGHYPIVEVCVIKNNITGKTTEVGNCCVKKFLEIENIGYDVSLIFQAIKRILENISNSANLDTIFYAQQMGIWNNQNVEFYHKIYKKRNLSLKQLKYKQDLNKKLLTVICRKRS